MATTTITEERPLSQMKAQLNGKNKKKPLKLSSATKEKQKAAQKAAAKKVAVKKSAPKKATPKVSTDVKAKKPKTEKAPKVPYETQEAEIAKLLGVSLKESVDGDKVRKTGETRNKAVLMSMPERKELIIKVNGKNVCEIFPRRDRIRFCSKPNFVSGINLPKGTKVNSHEKWNMTEEFSITKPDLASVLKQFTQVSTAKA